MLGLLQNSLTTAEKTFALVNGELFPQDKVDKSKNIDIEKWTNAFLIFSSIYTVAHPFHTIRVGARV